MGSDLAYNKYWLKKYILELYNEQDMANQILVHINRMIITANIEELPVLMMAESAIAGFKKEISVLIEVLEQYLNNADRSAQILEYSISKLKMPDFFNE